MFGAVYNAVKGPMGLPDLEQKDEMGQVLEGLDKIVAGMGTMF